MLIVGDGPARVRAGWVGAGGGVLYVLAHHTRSQTAVLGRLSRRELLTKQHFFVVPAKALPPDALLGFQLRTRAPAPSASANSGSRDLRLEAARFNRTPGRFAAGLHVGIGPLKDVVVNSPMGKFLQQSTSYQKSAGGHTKFSMRHDSLGRNERGPLGTDAAALASCERVSCVTRWHNMKQTDPR